MTYPLSDRLFLENGPANVSAEVRARRAAIAAYFAAEQARLEAARAVIGTEPKLAA